MADEETTGGDLLPAGKAKELQDKYGEIAVVKTVLGPVAFRSCKRAEYERYNSLLFDDKKRPKAFESLVKTCVVYPDANTFESYLDKKPGIVSTCLNAVLELSGVETEAETKKYSPV